MAQLTITSTARQDTAAKAMTDRANAQRVLGAPVLTVAQYVTQQIQFMLDKWVDQTEGETRLTKAQAYQKATPEDQSAIDGILAKYQ